MADIAATYTLVTPAGTLILNDGTAQDQYYVDVIQGLDQAPIRAPVDEMPFGHGGIWHDFWEGPRHILFEGMFLIRSEWGNMSAILAIRNSMEWTLINALRSIGALVTDVGVLGWTPYGQSARQLDVRCDQPVDFTEDQNYQVKRFHFGLVAVDPDWDGWSS
jgi:hypothetical protein